MSILTPGSMITLSVVCINNWTKKSGRNAVPAAFVVVLASFLLCACTGRGNFFVTPGKYHLYKCDQLVQQFKGNLEREKVLRALIDQASIAQGGSLVAKVAYGPEYATVQGSIDEIRVEATEKNCILPPPG